MLHANTANDPSFFYYICSKTESPPPHLLPVVSGVPLPWLRVAVRLVCGEHRPEESQGAQEAAAGAGVQQLEVGEGEVGHEGLDGDVLLE